MIGARLPIRSSIPIVDYELLESGAILAVAYLFARSIAYAIEAHHRQEHVVTPAYSVRLFLDLLIAAIVILLLFLVFGADVQSIFFGSAFLGIVLGLAAQTVLSNVFAGVTLAVSGPFRPGDRISLISSSYGALGPTHAHETLYPAYTGTVRATGLIYTTLQLDTGRIARIPNSVALQALVVNLTQTPFHSQRVRVTLPLAVPMSLFDELLTEYSRKFQPAGQGVPAPRVEVAEIGPSTWDAVVVLWTVESNEELIRDRVLRLLLPKAQTTILSLGKE